MWAFRNARYLLSLRLALAESYGFHDEKVIDFRATFGYAIPQEFSRYYVYRPNILNTFNR